MTIHLPLLLVTLLTGAAQAQSAVEASWAIGAVNPSTTLANEAMIQQAGASNQATLAILSGNANRLDISQMANQNAATIQIVGRANGLQLNQTGSGNVFNVDLQGSNNALMVSQQGGDVARLTGLMTSNAKLELIQRSGNNTLLADGPLTTGTGAANLRIEQSGGATARIQNGRPF